MSNPSESGGVFPNNRDPSPTSHSCFRDRAKTRKKNGREVLWKLISFASINWAAHFGSITASAAQGVSKLSSVHSAWVLPLSHHPLPVELRHHFFPKYFNLLIQFSSVQFSRSVVSYSLWPHEAQNARPPCPSPAPRIHSDSRPLSQWCHPAISSSVIPFSSCPQPLP